MNAIQVDNHSHAGYRIEYKSQPQLIMEDGLIAKELHVYVYPPSNTNRLYCEVLPLDGESNKAAALRAAEQLIAEHKKQLE